MMKHVTKLSIAVACALGVSAAVAQNVAPESSAKNAAAKKAEVRTPVQLAQAAGGTSSGASTAGAAGAGMSSTTAALVGLGVVAAVIAVSSEDNPATTTHH
jgi:hypothetical protein